VQIPPPLVSPGTSALQVTPVPTHPDCPPPAVMQQLPGEHVPAQHSSEALSGQATPLWLAVQPPMFAGTHVPRPVPVVVTQMSVAAHCPSLVQPPQKWAFVNPQVG
jgi:hypothetical protein